VFIHYFLSKSCIDCLKKCVFGWIFYKTGKTRSITNYTLLGYLEGKLF